MDLPNNVKVVEAMVSKYVASVFTLACPRNNLLRIMEALVVERIGNTINVVNPSK